MVLFVEAQTYTILQKEMAPRFQRGRASSKDDTAQPETGSPTVVQVFNQADSSALIPSVRPAETSNTTSLFLHAVLYLLVKIFRIAFLVMTATFATVSQLKPFDAHAAFNMNDAAVPL